MLKSVQDRSGHQTQMWINLWPLHAPQRRQDGSEQSRSQRQLQRGGGVTEICCATLERAGVASAQQGSSYGRPTEIRVEAASDVQFEHPRGIKL